MPVIYTKTPENLPERQKNELYETPAEVARSLVKLIPATGTFGTFLDVGCHNGVWGKALREKRPKINIVGIDISPREEEIPEYDAILQIDAFEYLGSANRNIHLFGNPPYFKDYRRMNDLIELALEFATVSFLLPAEYAGSVSRMKIFKKLGMPRHIYRVVPRINFIGRGLGNTANHAFFVWDQLRRESVFQYHIVNWKTGEIV